MMEEHSVEVQEMNKKFHSEKIALTNKLTTQY